MNDSIAALRLFVRVARLGSFSRAGREVGLPQPSVSRTIAALERQVGTTLLTRTTRAVVLTEAGADYLTRIEPILLSLEEANQAVRDTGELRGVLRVGLSSSIAIREVIPRLPAFMERHQALRVDLLMEDQRRDSLREGVDVALRIGPLADSGVPACAVGTNPRLVAASPAYLARVGAPETPADLARHGVIIGPTGTSSAGWSFERDGRKISVRVEGRLRASANEGAIAAAVAGLGIVSTGLWGCRAELASGALVRVLKDWKMDAVEIHAVIVAGQATRQAAHAFTDFLVSEFRDDDAAAMA